MLCAVLCSRLSGAELRWGVYMCICVIVHASISINCCGVLYRAVLEKGVEDWNGMKGAEVVYRVLCCALHACAEGAGRGYVLGWVGYEYPFHSPIS